MKNILFTILVTLFAMTAPASAAGNGNGQEGNGKTTTVKSDSGAEGNFKGR